MLETGKSAAVVARDLGVHEGTLQTWVHRAKARAAAEAAGGLDESEREELRRLREENRQLRKENTEIGMERDVLKRSVVLWVKEATK
ncbi:transposase [Streptomyces ehimensis]|uniref:Transposase n=1 Tax=Streptomyces ehimensis TaxID=68195 RepID=A0ABV9BU79_9ACTN